MSDTSAKTAPKKSSLKSSSANIDLGAMDAHLLFAQSGKFYLKRGGKFWTGKGHEESPAHTKMAETVAEMKAMRFGEQQSLADAAVKGLEALLASDVTPVRYVNDNRAYIEFRGPETDDGRKALTGFLVEYQKAQRKTDKDGKDIDPRPKEETDVAQNEIMCSFIERMAIGWRLFDGNGEPVDIKPLDETDDGGTQIRRLVNHWSQTAPRLLLEMAAFLQNRGNFSTA